VRFTLVCDGPSDQALIPILIWSLRRRGASEIEPQWADLRRIPDPPRQLVPKIRLTLRLFPCELLFIHRDAEAEPLEDRLHEIREAVDTLRDEVEVPPHVCVVPVRMTEAWLLQSEFAIRSAADNPNGRNALNLPPVRSIETLTDPKAVLYQLLVEASGLGQRRRRALNPRQLVYRIAELIDDFSALDQLPAFTRFNSELSRVFEQPDQADG